MDRINSLKMKKYSLFLFFFISLVSIAQQDPQYSQYMFNQLVLNPAYAGSKEQLDASMFLRRQWNIDGAPRTATVSIHTPLKKQKVGLGLSIVADKIGPKNSQGILASYAYRIRLFNGRLAFGLRAGVFNHTFRWDEIHYKESGDVYNTQNSASQIAPTADAGLYYYSNSIYCGLSFTHLLNGKINSIPNLNGDYASMSRHMFFTFGKAWAFSDKFIFNPSFVYKKAKGAPATFDINMSAMIDQKLWIGCSYRDQAAITAYTKFNISQNFSLGYAYDFGMNRIGKIAGGAHEIMLGYNLNVFKTKMISPRFL